MLETVGANSLDALIDADVPPSIRQNAAARSRPALTRDRSAGASAASLPRKNQVFTSLIGQGYYGTILPPVIQRNILENPAWYTAYTPYQPEISQGRLEALFNFQTMVCDLTGLDVANASLLDEATAAAEAMALAERVSAVQERRRSSSIATCIRRRSRCCAPAPNRSAGRSIVGDPLDRSRQRRRVRRASAISGHVRRRCAISRPAIAKLHAKGALAIVAADPLALTLLASPGELGADIAVGSTQRFGVPMGFGGPHAAYMAVRDALKRSMPGRLVGLSVDRAGAPAYRLALQTREQHIRREKATSNICTAQVLLAVIASMYAVYHGPEGLTHIARTVHRRAARLAAGLTKLGFAPCSDAFFDTVTVDAGARAGRDRRARAAPRRSICGSATAQTHRHRARRNHDAGDRRSGLARVRRRAVAMRTSKRERARGAAGRAEARQRVPHPSGLPRAPLRNRDDALHAPARRPRSRARPRHDPARLLHDEAQRHRRDDAGDLAGIRQPASVRAARAGARAIARCSSDSKRWLCEITGYDAVSLQPNSGAQGEYAGLLAIRAYHAARGEAHRNVCLIPSSAHGTNPASARWPAWRSWSWPAMRAATSTSTICAPRRRQHADNLAALMITYPSTHGVFEEDIREICDIVHEHGGQVYLDGANLNAQVGLARPGDFGADVSHINLHKTFCIPHGGGGPGMGPIGVKAHLAPFLPGHPASTAQHRPRSARCRRRLSARPRSCRSPGSTS